MNIKILLALSLLGLPECLAQQAAIKDVDVLEKEIKREPVPAAVLADAVRATQAVGDDTLQGRFDAVVAKLYPRSRKRAAKRLGSNEALAERMRKLLDEFAASGMTVTEFVAEPALYGFDIPEFREWLVFVPSSRKVRRIDPHTGLIQWLEINDYQVAIRKKGEGQPWSFINGSGLQIQELRTFFPSLPNDIEEYAVPKVSSRLLK